MRVERDGADQLCYGSNGRVYRIGYIPRAARPWIVNGNTRWENRHATIEEAIAYAHQLEAAKQ